MEPPLCPKMFRSELQYDTKVLVVKSAAGVLAGLEKMPVPARSIDMHLP